MKEAGLTDKVVHNFYLRNAIILLILLAATVARKIFMAGSFDLHGFLITAIGFTMLYLIIVFHNKVLYEKLLRRRRYLLYALSVLCILAFYNELFLPLVRALYNLDWYPETVTDKLLIQFCYLVDIYLGLGLYIGFHYFKEREDSLRLDYLKRDLELRQLKEQLNPHFLFNALNNIYSYALEDNTRSNELILKLGDLMRFIIDNANKDTIPLTEELAFVEDFIAFEEERLGKRCTVSFTKNIKALGVQIAPFILFTFIENAFKHGTAMVAQSHIDIGLKVDEHGVQLDIVNRVNKTIHASTRTGLANTRRRLALLYPNKHTLEITEDDELFKVYLVIHP